MVQESHDGTLGDLVGRAALGAVVAALLLLALGVVAELLRRRHRARRVLALLDLTVPMGVRAVIVSLLALGSTFMGPRPAGAADSVRGWLREVGPSTTTTTRVAVATPDAVAAHDAPSPSTAPTGPVVLIPPITAQRPDPAPRPTAPVVAPAPRAPVATAATSVPAAAPVAVLPTYVVRRGDCLWAIAAGLLGPRADARSIDAGWRAIYAANRAAIGDDPNLIRIGLTLALPPLHAQP